MNVSGNDVCFIILPKNIKVDEQLQDATKICKHEEIFKHVHSSCFFNIPLTCTFKTMTHIYKTEKSSNSGSLFDGSRDIEYCEMSE